MSEAKIRKRLKQLSNQDEQNRLSFEDDRIFFEQNPKRNYRLRLSTPNEIAALKINGTETELPDNWFWYTVTRQITPGVRCRGFISRLHPPGRNEPSDDILQQLFAAAIWGAT
jgi:hypothetical protein